MRSGANSSTKAYRRNYTRQRREIYPNEGMCVNCGTRPSKQTSTLCERCTHQMVENRKLLASQRVAEGFCTQCLVSKPEPGRRLCESCKCRKRLTPEQRREKTYGLTDEKYQAMFKQQAGACAICGRTGELHVDHCHASGSVRGLLCTSCNNGLGRFRDSPEILRAAAEYVEHVQ